MVLLGSVRRFVNLMKTRWAVVMSGLPLGVSTLYCLAGLVLTFSGQWNKHFANNYTNCPSY